MTSNLWDLAREFTAEIKTQLHEKRHLHHIQVRIREREREREKRDREKERKKEKESCGE